MNPSEEPSREPAPMSDRRAVLVVLGCIAAVLGAALVALALLQLDDPLVPSGETGERVDVTRLLVGAIGWGALLLVGGIGLAVGLVRRQLRADPRCSERG